MLFSLHQPHRLHFPAPHVTARRQEWEWGRREGYRGADSHKNCDWVKEKGQQNLRLAHNSAAFHPFFLFFFPDSQVVSSGNTSSSCDNFLWTLDFPSLFPSFEDAVIKFNIFFTIHFASIFFYLNAPFDVGINKAEFKNEIANYQGFIRTTTMLLSLELTNDTHTGTLQPLFM